MNFKDTMAQKKGTRPDIFLKEHLYDITPNVIEQQKNHQVRTVNKSVFW